jgi:CopG family transcriptional regulator/antitoxin EndoAI
MYRLKLEVYGLADEKRITVTLPASLVSEIDGLGEEARDCRSEFLMEAARRYLEDLKKEALRRRLIEGYQEMAQLNLTLAEEGLATGLDLSLSRSSEGD